MKHSARYVLALTLVATTLCAGRLFASDHNVSPETKLLSEKLVARLTKSFSRTVSRSPLVVTRQTISPLVPAVIFISTDRSFSLALSPCEFRLPPPLL